MPGGPPGRPKGCVDKRPRKKRGPGTLDAADASVIRGRQRDRQAVEKLKGHKNPKIARDVQDALNRVATMDIETREVLKLLPPPSPTNQRILDLRASGMIQSEIAEELGLDRVEVSNRLVDALGQLHGELVRDVDSARTVALLRLERVLGASWPAAMAGGTEAVGNVLKILDRQAKYLGLDAAQKVDVSLYIKQMAQEYDLDEAELEAEFVKIRPELPPG